MGDLTAGNVFIDVRALTQGLAASSLFSCVLDIVGYNDFTFSGQRLAYARHFISGYVSSGGAVTLTDTTELDRVNVGAAAHPVFTIAGTSGGITITGDSFTNSTSRIDVKCQPLRL